MLKEKGVTMALSPFTVEVRAVLEATLDIEAPDGDTAYDLAQQKLDSLYKFHDLNGIRVEGSWERKETEVVGIYQED